MPIGYSRILVILLQIYENTNRSLNTSTTLPTHLCVRFILFFLHTISRIILLQLFINILCGGS